MKKYYKVIYVILAILTIAMIIDIYKSYFTPERLLKWAVEKKLKANINDPSSYEFVDFYKNPISIEDKNPESEYFTLKFRGKNKFGAIILDEIKIEAQRYSIGNKDSEYMIIAIE